MNRADRASRAAGAMSLRGRVDFALSISLNRALIFALPARLESEAWATDHSAWRRAESRSYRPGEGSDPRSAKCAWH